MYNSPSGWPPLVAQHYRQARCGRHLHVVCCAGACTSHLDEWNPDCDGELVEHMRVDFWPAYKVPILIGAALLGLVLLSQA